MKRFLHSVLILIAIIVFAILTLLFVLIVLRYKDIKEGTPVARYFTRTILDEYQGVWARNPQECNIGVDISSRTLLITREGYPISNNFKFQCDLIKFSKNGDPDNAIQLGCWKVIGRSIADGRSKAVYDFGIIDRNNVTIGNDTYTRCEPQ